VSSGYFYKKDKMDSQIILFPIPLTELDEHITAAVNKAVARITKPEPVNDRIGFAEACILIGVSKSKLYKLTAENKVPCSRFGRKVVFSKKELLQWVDEHTFKEVSDKDKAIKELQKEANKKRK
jgi:excisionase family DNA binding protein